MNKKNIAIILSGGVGSRMGNIGTAKQYLNVNGKPIISYCLDTFESHPLIDNIIIVAAEEQHRLLYNYNYSKLSTIVANGTTRQHSVLNGLKAAIMISGNQDDVVLIHDSVRPLVSNKIIQDCIEAIGDYDGAMPSIKVKDTIYQSHDGLSLNKPLDRSELYAGQSPESFVLSKYYAIHQHVTEEELSNVTGSSVIAIKHGLRIKLIAGGEQNFKITTIEDLELFKNLVLNYYCPR